MTQPTVPPALDAPAQTSGFPAAPLTKSKPSSRPSVVDAVPDSLGHYVRMYFQFDPKSKLASLRLKNQLGATEVAFYCFADAIHPSAPSAPRSRIRTKLAVGLDQVLVERIAGVQYYASETGGELTTNFEARRTRAFKVGFLGTGSKSQVNTPVASVFVAPFNGSMQQTAPGGEDWLEDQTPRTTVSS